MQKIISYPISILFVIIMLIVLCVFHALQWIAFNLFGYKAHNITVNGLVWWLMACTGILGTSYKFRQEEELPTDRPIIFVSNHQSMFDIPMIIWFFRKNHPKFVSKKELGKGFPSVSYNLNHGGSVLIDRKDAKQALSAIKGLGQYITKHNRSAVIFPEGTRSRDGKLKRFSENGVKMLCKFAPDALVVPLTINNSWKIFRFGNFPYGLGAKISLYAHQPFAVKEYSFEEIMKRCEEQIKSKLE
ncbi:1-acyl-sn-glycerol-3-phosphate acyltransferase [Myroides odoratimimus]|uniref:Glycerol acyltransferase n=2 Tax=Myroides odoratimimus TaxID=76832 RepID=A0A0S7EA83_9FLAO|nr:MULTISPECIES: 1-acyl-sn-glycerol-3-phosphate acyltransferase [Myroides]AJA68181.1 1-acyl-sn-glycerol-3-phosphate acyltransferase [Myroides sp. A21]ALU25486.1 glycerol acyltransferase [Myroides odoratimimus]APA91507.1 1-acyl-sn-glycerol-3-phosphate acyltransferase [Myroides sp. ZB35]EHO06846.1 1-acylglycerol-3-phosphate O-acyltransferase [Myroides odoratimimus CCUG 10230]MCA4805993.1 1-acyl-sn-glycerol-3-phosphate acyltransferase [Myroides odoratimimus]